MIYKYIALDVDNIDPYTIASRLDEAKTEWLIWEKINVPLLGNKIAAREFTFPILKIDAWEQQQDFLSKLIKMAMLLLYDAKERNIHKAILVLAFNKVLTEDSSMFRIDTKAALFKQL